MSIPFLRFAIDPDKDVATLFAFDRDAVFDRGESLAFALLTPFPQCAAWLNVEHRLSTSREAIERFVTAEYTRHDREMRSRMEAHALAWRGFETSFDELTGSLDIGKWPEGEYVVYATIWGLYPKFLENKTFHIPWNHSDQAYLPVIIAHEMLHFLWYSFFYRCFPQYIPDKDDLFVWNVSEIFNAAVQASPPWKNVFHRDPMPYPQHASILRIIQSKIEPPFNGYSLTALIIAECQQQGIGMAGFQSE